MPSSTSTTVEWTDVFGDRHTESQPSPPPEPALSEVQPQCSFRLKQHDGQEELVVRIVQTAPDVLQIEIDGYGVPNVHDCGEANLPLDKPITLTTRLGSFNAYFWDTLWDRSPHSWTLAGLHERNRRRR